MEEWRPICGFEGYYEISDNGNVRSVDRIIIKNNGVSQRRIGRPKSLRVNKDGYYTVKLSKDGADRVFFVHRLVYETFIDKIPDGCEINHKDFDRKNNRQENLEAVSHYDNVKYSYESGRHYTIQNDLSGLNNPNYGNHVLSQKYADDPELSKRKQGRPGLQNGRCQKVVANFPDGTIKEYGCVHDCAANLIEMGISNGTIPSVYSRIWYSAKNGTPYKNIGFEYI